MKSIYEKIAHLPRKVELGSAYKYYGDQIHPDFTSYSLGFKGTIDYILYSKSTYLRALFNKYIKIIY